MRDEGQMHGRIAIIENCHVLLVEGDMLVFHFTCQVQDRPIIAMYYSFSCPYVSTVLWHMLGRFAWQSSEKANLTCTS